MTKDKLTPKTANTINKVCKLERDNLSTKDYWILISGDHVTIAKQKNGEPLEASLQIPKAVLNRFIEFYETGE